MSEKSGPVLPFRVLYDAAARLPHCRRSYVLQ